MNGTINPSQPPNSAQKVSNRVYVAAGLLECSIWIVLAIVTWFGQSMMLPIYQDFDLGLSTLTRMMSRRMVPILLVGASLLVAYLLFKTTGSPQRRLVTTTSLCAAVAYIAVAVYALFSPLVIMIESLR